MITQLTEAAETVLKRRYYLKDEEGNCIEKWPDLCKRVAKFISTAESDPTKRGELEDAYFTGIYNLDWMPNTPALTNAGTDVGMLSACIVLGVVDSISGIFDTMRDAALCHKEGSGTGFSFSDIRPANSKVKSTNGIASGPLSFIKIYNEATEAIKQGGKRRGANLATLSVDHPDIEEFIDAKEDLTQFNNFNFSVGITDEFMEKVKAGEEKETIVFNKIVDRAWRTGEPGCLFLDTINKNSPVIHLGEIKSSNPCGEIPLLPGESCNLASINLANHLIYQKSIDIYEVDWYKLQKTIETCVYFLNGVIDKNKYPIKSVEEMTKKTRKIGLGIMGLHDMLIRLELPYASDSGRDKAAQVMKFVEENAIIVSEGLAKIHGPFPGYDREKCQYPPRRNATVTSIQPTGSTSMICDCSSGCEPVFSYVMVKNVMGGTHLLMVNSIFEEIARKNGFYSEPLMKKVSETGSVIHPEIPEYWQEILRTAGDITPEDHVKMLCALQTNGVQNAVSKTINAPETATRDDIAKAYMMAWEGGAKGLTVYRNNCRANQVLNTVGNLEKQTATVNTSGPVKADLPDTLRARRYKVKLDEDESLYIIICFDDVGKPMEVFAKFPYDNQIQYREKNTMYTVTCRLISLGLRYGIPVEEIIKQLDKSSGSMVDLPSQLTKLLKMFLSETDKPYSAPCPECGEGLLVFEEGCACCKSCGYSKCS